MTADDDQMLDRVLANEDSRAGVTRFGGRATALDDDTFTAADLADDGFDGDQLDREERASRRRVAGLSTELEDVTEVEYRQLRLENVVLIGVYAGNSLEEAEN